MMRRLWPLLVFGLLAVLLLIGVRMNAGKDASVIPSPLIGKQAPVFSLPVLDEPSRQVSGTDLLGQPYLLNIWGSWCPSCRVEHPVVASISKSNLVRVIGYNYKDDPEDARRWLREFGNPYSLVLTDEDGRAALDWGIYGAPETFMVDARGVVRWKFVGPLTDDVIQTQLKPALETAR